MVSAPSTRVQRILLEKLHFFLQNPQPQVAEVVNEKCDVRGPWRSPLHWECGSLSLQEGLATARLVQAAQTQSVERGEGVLVAPTIVESASHSLGAAEINDYRSLTGCGGGAAGAT